jgi:hypothetical protein
MTDQRFDGVAAGAAISGLSKAEVRCIWENAKANIRRLDACPGPHVFVVRPEDAAKPLTARHVCSVCHGEVSASDRRWYERGVADGRKAVDETP